MASERDDYKSDSSTAASGDDHHDERAARRRRRLRDMISEDVYSLLSVLYSVLHVLFITDYMPLILCAFCADSRLM